MTGLAPRDVVECVPNYSEGRRPEVVDAIRGAIAGSPGAHVLDASMDASHNRSVITFVAPAAAVVAAAFAGVQAARDLIDLRDHAGVHPRIGAADVVPFVPLGRTTMAACVDCARALGARVGAELELPVFLYEEAATRAAFRNLAEVRRGGFEGLREAIAGDAARAPDFGPSRVHERAGAVAVGARRILVAYNVYLGATASVAVARAVARAVRESSGGLPGVKALGLEVAGEAQVSMNLVDVDRTPLHVAFAAVAREAAARGAEVGWSEIIGLVPRRSWLDAQAHGVPIRTDGARPVLEDRIEGIADRL
jgi:glutamate formiminotransferase